MTGVSTAAPIIVTATFAPSDQRWLDALRTAHFPPERNHLAAHLTLLHHLPPSIVDELARRLAQAASGPAPAAAVTGIMNLGRGTALRIEAPGLVAVRRDLADAFSGLLTPQDTAGWRPHVTIQNKVDAFAARRLQAELDAASIARPLAVRGLAAWWYRGGPWEPIREYRFRGA